MIDIEDNLFRRIIGSPLHNRSHIGVRRLKISIMSDFYHNKDEGMKDFRREKIGKISKNNNNYYLYLFILALLFGK